MRIEQVNTGAARFIESGGNRYKTGIYKEAVEDAVGVGYSGLVGDEVCDERVHGGPDQAVYLYSLEDYAWFSAEVGEQFEAGLFGENLTTSGLDLTDLCIGDRLISADIAMQVTAPRIPCNTLESRVGLRGFAKRFVKANRSGAYCRVLSTGQVRRGDRFEWSEYEGARVPLTQFFTDMKRKLSAEELEGYLNLPIDKRTRADFAAKLLNSR